MFEKFVKVPLTMPVLRSAEQRRPNTRLEDFLVETCVNSLAGGGEPASPDRPNMVVRRRASRGGSRETGASQTLVQSAPSLPPNTEVLANDTRESHNGMSADGENEVSDGIVAMGLANADLTSGLQSLTTTVMALFRRKISKGQPN